MKLPQTRAGRVAGAVGAAIVLSGAGTGVALAASNSPAPAATHGTTTPAHHQGRRHAPLLFRLLGRASHGELVLNTKKGPQTVDFQRGVVSAVSASTVTVTSPGGYSHSYTLTPASRIAAPHAKGTKATAADVVAQDRAIVVALPSGTVRFLAAHPAHRAHPTASSAASSGA